MRGTTACDLPPRLAPCKGWSSMPLDWAPFVELVRRHRRFLLTTHVRPDGDGLGSMLALADALEHAGQDGADGRRQRSPAALRLPRPRAARAATSSRPATPTATPRPSSSSTPAPGTSSATSGLSCSRLTCRQGGHRPPPDAGRPRRACAWWIPPPRRPAGWSSRRSAALGVPLQPRAAPCPVRGPGDGHRLVPPQQHHAGHLRPGRASWSRPAPGPTEAYEQLFEQNTLGPAQADGPGAGPAAT